MSASFLQRENKIMTYLIFKRLYALNRVKKSIFGNLHFLLK